MKVQSSMLKVQNYNLKFKVILISLTFLSLCTLHFALCTSLAFAVDSSPSADLKTKLKSLQDQIASKASEIKQTISAKLQNKAYWGKVLSKTDSTLTLATKTGSKIISVNQDTVFSYSKGKLSLKTILVDDFIVGLGDVDETVVLSARKIIKLTIVEFPDLKTHWGVVTNIGDSQFTLQASDKDIIVFVDSKTELKFGGASAEFTDIKLKKSVIIVGLPYKIGIKARFVYILPYTSINLKTSPIASPSILLASPSNTLKKLTPTPVKK